MVSPYRLAPVSRPGRVRLQVADLARSLDYYRRVIGLDVRSQSSGHAELGPHDEERVLVEIDERPGAQLVPRRGSWGLFHFAILLPDRASLGRFVEHALPTGSVTGMSDHAVSEAVYLSDPDGLGIEVYADRPRDEWRIGPTGELHMTTDPLDVMDVAAAGHGQPWTGAPHGTVMGHVHLHVGDLAEADAFYRRALGFDKTVWTYPGALFFSAGGYHHHLGTNTWSAARRAADDQARLLSWDLIVPDAASAEETARSVATAGYDVRKDGDSWTARDPWGTGLRLVPGPESRVSGP